MAVPTSPTAVPPSPPRPAATQLPIGARVLVIRLSALGDVLFALETVAALKRARPDVRIDFLVEDRFASLLERHPQLERVHVVPRRRPFAVLPALLRLRRERYDVVLDLHGILKSALQVAFCRARRTLGFAAGGAREGAWRFYDEAVPLPEPLPHRADRGYFLLEALGLPATPCAPQLAVDEPPAAVLQDLAHPLVVLHPGTSAFASFKRWPLDRFTELAARLRRRGFGIAVSYGPGEDDLAAAIAAGAAGARPVSGKELGIRGLAGVLRRADVVVAADTGPLHLAGAVGTACVALFGPKEVARYGPRSHGPVPPEVLFHDVPCRPCTRRDCVSPQCVLGVPVDAVEAAVLRQLERRR